jgi:hypothetical protein
MSEGYAVGRRGGRTTVVLPFELGQAAWTGGSWPSAASPSHRQTPGPLRPGDPPGGVDPPARPAGRAFSLDVDRSGRHVLIAAVGKPNDQRPATAYVLRDNRLQRSVRWRLLAGGLVATPGPHPAGRTASALKVGLVQEAQADPPRMLPLVSMSPERANLFLG